MKYLHTMVRVTDLDGSLRFYCNALGLHEVRRYDNEQGRFTLVFLAAPGSATGRPSEGANFDSLPTELVLTGVVRDFKAKTVSGGHPDFENRPAGGFGHYVNNVGAELDSDNKPVFVGGGRRIATQWRDSSGRNILPSLYNAALGDRAGAFAGGADNGGGGRTHLLQPALHDRAVCAGALRGDARPCAGLGRHALGRAKGARLPSARAVRRR